LCGFKEISKILSRITYLQILDFIIAKK